ncbi:MAG: hypothetical protein HYR85_03820 [Planctomycetes bacterium]|nr:hypothetical protein [Planctomycetota bacterium]MBI3848500.1 hypothetical protein [Planctomycetota bacterium]
MKGLLLSLLVTAALAPVASAQITLDATPDIGPGDTLILHVNGTPAGAHVAIAGSLHVDGGFTLGPRTTPCGTVEIHFDIGPPARLLAAGRADRSGEFIAHHEFLRLHPRLDGVILYTQAAAIAFRRGDDGACTIVAGTSNVAQTTFHVPH